MDELDAEMGWRCEIGHEEELLTEIFEYVCEEEQEALMLESSDSDSVSSGGRSGVPSPEIWGDPLVVEPQSPEVWGDPVGEIDMNLPTARVDSNNFPILKFPVVLGDCDSNFERYSPEIGGDIVNEYGSNLLGGEFDDLCGSGSDNVSDDSYETCELYSPEIRGDGGDFQGMEDMLPLDENGEDGEGRESPRGSEIRPSSPDIGSDNPCSQSDAVGSLLTGREKLANMVSSRISTNSEGSEFEKNKELLSGEGTDRQTRDCKRKKYSDKKLNMEPVVELEILGSSAVEEKKLSAARENVLVEEKRTATCNFSTPGGDSNERIDRNGENVGESICKSLEESCHDNASLECDFTEECAFDDVLSEEDEYEILAPPFETFTDDSDAKTEVSDDDTNTGSNHSDMDTLALPDTEIIDDNVDSVVKNTPETKTEENFMPVQIKPCVPTTTSRVVGRNLEAIIAPTNQSGQLEWIVKFQDNPCLDLVSAELIHENFPQSVIRYLERRVHFDTHENRLTVRLLQPYEKPRV